MGIHADRQIPNKNAFDVVDSAMPLFMLCQTSRKLSFEKKKTQAYNRRRFKRKLSNWLFDFARFHFSRCQQHNIVLLSVMSIRIALKLSFRMKKMNRNSV